MVGSSSLYSSSLESAQDWNEKLYVSSSSSSSKRRVPFLISKSLVPVVVVEEVVVGVEDKEEVGRNYKHRGANEILGDDATVHDDDNDDDVGQSGKAKNDNSSFDNSVISL